MDNNKDRIVIIIIDVIFQLQKLEKINLDKKIQKVINNYIHLMMV
jgi:hypothetical protein